jgi:hypothetical protein
MVLSGSKKVSYISSISNINQGGGSKKALTSKTTSTNSLKKAAPQKMNTSTQKSFSVSKSPSKEINKINSIYCYFIDRLCLGRLFYGNFIFIHNW